MISGIIVTPLHLPNSFLSFFHINGQNRNRNQVQNENRNQNVDPAYNPENENLPRNQVGVQPMNKESNLYLRSFFRLSIMILYIIFGSLHYL